MTFGNLFFLKIDQNIVFKRVWGCFGSQNPHQHTKNLAGSNHFFDGFEIFGGPRGVEVKVKGKDPWDKILGSKMGGQIGQRSIQKGIEKHLDIKSAARWPTRLTNSFPRFSGGIVPRSRERG